MQYWILNVNLAIISFSIILEIFLFCFYPDFIYQISLGILSKFWKSYSTTLENVFGSPNPLWVKPSLCHSVQTQRLYSNKTLTGFKFKTWSKFGKIISWSMTLFFHKNRNIINFNIYEAYCSNNSLSTLYKFSKHNIPSFLRNFIIFMQLLVVLDLRRFSKILRPLSWKVLTILILL